MGRPEKPADDKKKPVCVRLYELQIKTLLLYGSSTQKGMDYLIKWANENWDLIENNPSKE